MFFSDLLSLNYEVDKKIPIEELKFLGLDLPDDVLEQFCSDHATNEDFQSQYGHLNLCKVKWKCQKKSAIELMSCTIYPRFEGWTDSVSKRVKSFQSREWNCIDERPEIVNYWSQFKTWLRPPIFMKGHLMNQPNTLRLVEGHTRFGILRGLVREGIIPQDSKHEIWLGYEH